MDTELLLEDIEEDAEIRRGRQTPALEATQGQMVGLLSQLPYKCHLEEVVSVGD